jgi:hypothetical protein
LTTDSVSAVARCRWSRIAVSGQLCEPQPIVNRADLIVLLPRARHELLLLRLTACVLILQPPARAVEFNS